MKETALKYIAYCGLYCPKCYKMKISASADSLLCELKAAKEKGAKYLTEKPEINEILNSLISLRCKKFCRQGGGKSKVCAIKKCRDLHGVVGCWKCAEFSKCGKLKPQFFKNNRKIKKIGLRKYVLTYK